MSTITAPPATTSRGDAEHPPVLVLDSRWATRIAWVWFAAAAVWALGDLVVLVADGRLAWDVVMVPVLFAVGVACQRASLRLDEDGFEISDGFRSHRVLWASVERIEVDWSRRLDAGVHVLVRRAARPLPLQATWGLRPDERAELVTLLRAAAAAHGITLDVRS